MAATVMRMSSSTEFFHKMAPAFPPSPSTPSASTSSASLSTTAALLSQLGCAAASPNEISQSDASATSLLFLSSVADSSSDMSEEDDDGDDSSSSSSWSGDDMLSPPSPTMCSSPTCTDSNCNDHDHLDQFSYSSKKSSCTSSSSSSSSHKKSHINNPSLLQYYQSLLNKPEGSSFKLKRKRTRPPMPTEVFCRICMVKSTPEWRRGPDGYKSLCNACGLRFAQMLRRERMLPTPDQSSLEKVKINALLN